MDGPCGRNDIASLAIGYMAGYIDFPKTINADQQLISSSYSCTIGSIAAAFRNEFLSTELYEIAGHIHKNPDEFAKAIRQFIKPKTKRKISKAIAL